MKTAIEDAESEMTQAWEETEQQLTSFADGIEQIQQDMESLQSEAEGQWTELVDEIGETQTSAIETLLGDFNEELSENQANEIAEAFSQMEDALTQLLSEFGTQAEATGNQFQEQASEILSTVAEHLENALIEGVETAFQDAIDEVVAEIAEEIAKSLALMVTGAGITTALAPILPILVAAKVAIGAIKAALKLLTFGFGG